MRVPARLSDARASQCSREPRPTERGEDPPRRRERREERSKPDDRFTFLMIDLTPLIDRPMDPRTYTGSIMGAEAFIAIIRNGTSCMH